MIRILLAFAIVAVLCNRGYSLDKPNVVFILADDLGYSDVGFMGSEFYETPNIDRLAERGLHFTNAYAAAPLCSATRCSIQTGQYPARTGLTGASGHLEAVILEKRVARQAGAKFPYTEAISTSRMDTEHFTLAEAFHAAGYKTAHFGKWHLGSEPYDPLHQGYDLDVPHTPAPSPLPNGFFYPFHVWKDKGKPGDNLEDLLVQEAARFIEKQANSDSPFFLAYWAFQVHSPWQAKEAQISHYRNRAKPEAHQRNPVYAGMVETLDDAVGTLVQALSDSGQLDNTIIVFTSDNGGFDYNHAGPHMPDEFKQVPVTDNYPLRAGKATVYEGGVRVPTLVVWPSVTEAGKTSNEVISSIDWYPTFADLLGLPVAGRQAFDGVSIAAALRGGKLDRDALFCHFPHAPGVPDNNGPATTVRQGNWKLIRFFHTNPDQTHHLELYDLAEDPGESANLVSQHPDVVENLDRRIAEFLAETEAAIPLANPNYRQPAIR